MLSGETNGLTPCHTRSRARGHGKALHGDRETRVSEVPLLRCSSRRHPPRAYLSQSRGVGKSAPTACPRDVPHVEAARTRPQVESGKPFTEDRNLRMGIDVTLKRRYT